MKELNGRLLQDYGLPAWGSYAIFAAATIFIGALLGLILVCIIDFLFPPKQFNRQSFSVERLPASDDIRSDDLEDENEALIDSGEDEEEEEEEDDDEDDEGEKYSGTDSEDDGDADEKPESDKKKKTTTISPKSSPKVEKSSPKDVRKRKTRKAD